jgi:hypothetical protein
MVLILQFMSLAAIKIYENPYNHEHLFTGIKGIERIELNQAKKWPFGF